MMATVINSAKVLAMSAKTAIAIATSTCVQDGHGTHVSCAVLNSSGKMEPRETRATVKRLRALADELESTFIPKGYVDGD